LAVHNEEILLLLLLLLLLPLCLGGFDMDELSLCRR
jgi:hypothetical protein